ncbi:hypothetical protein JOC69_000280 [Heliobacterium gestii]|nr:hypothetical protein [Heliomicrobium gestii]
MIVIGRFQAGVAYTLEIMCLDGVEWHKSLSIQPK